MINEILSNNIWTFYNFLTDKECDFFIEKINKKENIINFTMSGNFKNDKYINNELAQSFFYKVKKTLNINILRANNLIMTGKYTKNNEFGLHTDTGLYFDFIKKEKSNYTLLIYLNDNFKGGYTTFYDNNLKKTVSIKPKKGMALLFDISLWHKGCKILKGEKYWVGCEIISNF